MIFRILVRSFCLFNIFISTSVVHAIQTVGNCESSFAQTQRSILTQKDWGQINSQTSIDERAEIISKRAKKLFQAKDATLNWGGPSLPPYVAGVILPFQQSINQDAFGLSKTRALKRLTRALIITLQANSRLIMLQESQELGLISEINSFVTSVNGLSNAEALEKLSRIDSKIKSLLQYNPISYYPGAQHEPRTDWLENSKPFSRSWLVGMIQSEIIRNFKVSSLEDTEIFAEELIKLSNMVVEPSTFLGIRFDLIHSLFDTLLSAAVNEKNLEKQKSFIEDEVSKSLRIMESTISGNFRQM